MIHTLRAWALCHVNEMLNKLSCTSDIALVGLINRSTGMPMDHGGANVNAFFFFSKSKRRRTSYSTSVLYERLTRGPICAAYYRCQNRHRDCFAVVAWYLWSPPFKTANIVIKEDKPY